MIWLMLWLPHSCCHLAAADLLLLLLTCCCCCCRWPAAWSGPALPGPAAASAVSWTWKGQLDVHHCSGECCPGGL